MFGFSTPAQKGKLILILGPSGSGKGVVIEGLRSAHPEFVFPVSCTTRQPRPGEKNGEVYRFISRSEFQKRVEAGDFLEWAVVHHDNFYGTLKKPILSALSRGETLIREVDVQGMNSILRVLPKRQVVTIFLATSSWEILRKRILRRHHESDEEMRQRKQSYEKEMGEAGKTDYVVPSVEGEISNMIREVENIIAKERE